MLTLSSPAIARKPAPPPPEIPLAEQGLVDNVNGYTLDERGQLARFSGLLIDRQGKVARLLHEGDARPQRPDFRLDGQHRTLLPGLIDAHGHVGELDPSTKAAPLPRERDQVLAAAQDALLADGITAACDLGTDVAAWEAMRRLGDAGRLRVRILSYALGLEPLLIVAGEGPTPWLYEGRLRMAGVLLRADGALPRDTAQLKNLMSRAAMDDFQVAVNAIGPAGEARARDAIKELSETYQGDRRWRVEHLPAAIGTGDPNPFHDLADATTLAPERGPALVKALAALTTGAAYAAKAEERIGSLEPGHFADFILVDRDPFQIDPAALRETKVLETWIGGQRAWVRK